MMKKTAIFLSIILFACSSKPSKPTKEQVLDKMHDFVKNELKAPATAEFSGDEYKNDGDTVYLATGKVDAQNSFGAKIRETYLVKMRYLGGDVKQDSAWKVELIDVQ